MGKPLSTYQRAQRVLAARDHGVVELTRKLRRKGCPADEVDNAVARLAELGYLDDAGLLRREFARQAERGSGPRAIVRKLCARGFPPADVDAARAEAEAEGRFEGRCAAVLRERFGPPSEGWDRKRWAQAARFLVARGFGEGEVRDALREYHIS